jgi:hypothetical protein
MKANGGKAIVYIPTNSSRSSRSASQAGAKCQFRLSAGRSEVALASQNDNIKKER